MEVIAIKQFSAIGLVTTTCPGLNHQPNSTTELVSTLSLVAYTQTGLNHQYITISQDLTISLVSTPPPNG
jgi:hypothetical protein